MQFRLTNRVSSSTTIFPEISKLRERETESLVRDRKGKKRSQNLMDTNQTFRPQPHPPPLSRVTNTNTYALRNECFGSGSELSRYLDRYSLGLGSRP